MSVRVTVTWPAGVAGDSVRTVARFGDAIRCGSRWAWVRKSPSKAGAEAVGQDAIKHLGELGVQAQYEVTTGR